MKYFIKKENEKKTDEEIREEEINEKKWRTERRGMNEREVLIE